jgi:GNAT superfamily N-acetyltransferase
MNTPNYRLIPADASWADRYRTFCQRAYVVAYPKPEIGVTKDLFSEEVFASGRIVTYFADLCRTTEMQEFWLALDDQDSILGGVVVQLETDHCEMKAFYVDAALRGQGIGHALFKKVLDFAGHRDICVDVVQHMNETIAMYEHWGFAIDHARGKAEYGWPEWPEQAREHHYGIYMIRKASYRD